jgi:hypothetical protein
MVRPSGGAQRPAHASGWLWTGRPVAGYLSHRCITPCPHPHAPPWPFQAARGHRDHYIGNAAAGSSWRDAPHGVSCSAATLTLTHPHPQAWLTQNMLLWCRDQPSTSPDQPVVLGAHFEQLLDEFVEYAIGLQSKLEAEGTQLASSQLPIGGSLASIPAPQHNITSRCGTCTWQGRMQPLWCVFDRRRQPPVRHLLGRIAASCNAVTDTMHPVVYYQMPACSNTSGTVACHVRTLQAAPSAAAAAATATAAQEQQQQQQLPQLSPGGVHGGGGDNW